MRRGGSWKDCCLASKPCVKKRCASVNIRALAEPHEPVHCLLNCSATLSIGVDCTYAALWNMFLLSTIGTSSLYNYISCRSHTLWPQCVLMSHRTRHQIPLVQSQASGALQSVACVGRNAADAYSLDYQV
jgi:hypothetical protein